MDDTTAGQRLKSLHDQIAQLTTRADELADTISAEPTPLPTAVIDDLRAYVADAVASGTPAERKAAIEALVAEVRITEDGLIPVFRIPSPQSPVPSNAAATACEPPVRTMLRLVGPVGLEPTLPGT